MYPGSYLPEMSSGSLRLGPLFLESFHVTVSSGLAGAHVQPVLENEIPEAFGCWLLAFSWMCFG
jgi:hypothetical protein